MFVFPGFMYSFKCCMVLWWKFIAFSTHSLFWTCGCSCKALWCSWDHRFICGKDKLSLRLEVILCNRLSQESEKTSRLGYWVCFTVGLIYCLIVSSCLLPYISTALNCCQQICLNKHKHIMNWSHPCGYDTIWGNIQFKKATSFALSWPALFPLHCWP